MNAVRGNGSTVTTVWATRKASGNHGPAAAAQSRISTALGKGTQMAIATRITIAVPMPTARRNGICAAVVCTADRTVRSALTTGFTPSKGTGPSPITDVRRVSTGWAAAPASTGADDADSRCAVELLGSSDLRDLA
ncbi:hypothetical protein GCM10009856_57140 [Mycolicibacterium llatzerense]